MSNDPTGYGWAAIIGLAALPLVGILALALWCYAALRAYDAIEPDDRETDEDELRRADVEGVDGPR